MTDSDIYCNIKTYFDIQEFVGPRTYKRYGNRAWRFFDLRLLETMIILREAFGKPITINNWHIGGRFSQRGLRTNVQPLVKKKTKRNKLYISAHILGKAVDFDVKGMTARQSRAFIIENIHLLPYKIRLEAGVTWVHLDTTWEDKNPKIHIFEP